MVIKFVPTILENHNEKWGREKRQMEEKSIPWKNWKIFLQETRTGTGKSASGFSPDV